ncbi:hypothetical protein MAR_001555 [Mya arenaria]|uniref:Uncharacterized protein n=1 Tax=Mya arenaria TaxID=6604 RepID=A0ABY7FC45_MYAAR|nr:hypothetical protein MAR_001555 [Mya arenaria]
MFLFITTDLKSLSFLYKQVVGLVKDLKQQQENSVLFIIFPSSGEGDTATKSITTKQQTTDRSGMKKIGICLAVTALILSIIALSLAKWEIVIRTRTWENSQKGLWKVCEKDTCVELPQTSAGSWKAGSGFYLTIVAWLLAWTASATAGYQKIKA